MVKANLPFDVIDRKKIKILDKDSISVEYEIKLDSIKNQYNLKFEKEEEQQYAIEFLPGAITDFYENKNDSLLYRVKTRTYNDYGNLELNLLNAKFPIIVELISPNGEAKYEKYVTKNRRIEFKNIDSGKYFIRIIFDKNQNKKYDSGNFLKRIKPEKVIYYPDEIDVRAGWDLVQEFILQ